MKNIIFTLVVMFFSNNSRATIQEPDLLIIGNDTIELRQMSIFPLELLTLQIRPFGYTNPTGPGTSCWRGYRATWRIINDTLYLEKVQRCYADRNPDTLLNLIDFFQSNDIKITERNGLIFADWVNLNLYKSKTLNSIMGNYRKILTDTHFRRNRKNKLNYIFISIALRQRIIL